MYLFETGSLYAAVASLEPPMITEIQLLLPPEYWD